ncbi:hypothetical protein GCM10023093_26920 [Nemorincola caseinilytica]|uniref:Uncharacterized protein n=1 Tax=Nemorincola caseinilytica TaxID=2054315 RepID=A0ABP8NKG3_9BACT
MRRTILSSVLLLLSVTCLAQQHKAQPGSATALPAERHTINSTSATQNTETLLHTTAKPTPAISDRYERLAMLGNGNNANSELHPMHPGNGPGGTTMYIQDNGLREARYTSMVRPPSRNAFIDAGAGTVEARFDNSFRRFFYYCSSEYGRRKCDDTLFRKIANANCPHPAYPGSVHGWSLACGCAWSQCLYTYPFCPAHMVSDMALASDNTTRTSNSSQYFSFDGRIVYGTDTLYGIITITHSDVSVEHAHIKNTRSTRYALTDTQLHAITVYKSHKELHMVRLCATDKHLSRLVHAGRLTLYDRSYDFLTAGNVRKRITVITPAGMATINNTEELAAAINERYALRLAAGELSRKELITLLNRLD